MALWATEEAKEGAKGKVLPKGREKVLQEAVSEVIKKMTQEAG